MKKYIYIFITILAFLFASCSSNKSIKKTSEDKALFSVLKKLDKDPSNTELKNSVTNLYNAAAKSHVDKIEVYNTLTEADRWVKIIKEYEALKKLSEVISQSATAIKLVNPPDYSSQIQIAKQSGAEAYYSLGFANINIGDKQSSRNAYYAFKKVNDFVPGYKDVQQQIKIAYENSIITVVINPVKDNTFFTTAWGGIIMEIILITIIFKEVWLMIWAEIIIEILLRFFIQTGRQEEKMFAPIGKLILPGYILIFRSLRPINTPVM